MRLSFTVHGPPVPKARPRVVRTKYGEMRTFTPERTKLYELAVRTVAWLKYRGEKPTAKQLRCTLRFYMPSRRACDCDNLAKGVLDGMNGVVYLDDRQISELHIFRTIDKENPRAEVEIEATE
jgi:Holliday junction resolvase RusA-like endonuclease